MHYTAPDWKEVPQEDEKILANYKINNKLNYNNTEKT